eukprot:1177309-Prorocentrum_minimum.AAC.2
MGTEINLINPELVLAAEQEMCRSAPTSLTGDERAAKRYKSIPGQVYIPTPKLPAHRNRFDSSPNDGDALKVHTPAGRRGGLSSHVRLQVGAVNRMLRKP